MTSLPVRPPQVLLPRVDDPSKWAVIACDQFTGQPEYWRRLRELVGTAPSALDLILPEAFLEQRIEAAPGEIADAYARFAAAGLFESVAGYILVERTLSDDGGGDDGGGAASSNSAADGSGAAVSNGAADDGGAAVSNGAADDGGAVSNENNNSAPGKRRVRLGIMAAISLDDYEFSDCNSARIKATEQTVPGRLPIRVAIREALPIESPHVLMLYDDAFGKLVENWHARRDELDLLYDFELNSGGGHLRGWLIPDDISAQLAALERGGVLFVVGDGNHSLAAAKLAGDATALVELVNLHSEALEFEPIHRVVHGGGQELLAHLAASLSGPAELRIWYRDQEHSAPIPANPAEAIAAVQTALDQFGETHPDVVIDYIHGIEHLLSVAKRDNAVAIFMPTLAKDGLFAYVARHGALPRKSFSMGHAEDKRYYYELAQRAR